MSVTEILKKMNTIFCDVFDDDSIVINNNTTAEDIEDWDSLSHVMLVAALEREFQVEFNLDEISALNDVGDMVQLIQNVLGDA